jgi:hypothetical protein
MTLFAVTINDVANVVGPSVSTYLYVNNITVLYGQLAYIQ